MKAKTQMIRTFAAMAALLAFSLPVSAQTDGVATASVVSGPVQVNRGESFKDLQPGQALNPGDRVMALANGSTTIRFGDGCTLVVEPGTVVTVPSQSTCAGGVVNAQRVEGAAAGASGSYAGGIDWHGFWTVAGVAIVGGVILDSEDDENTVSP